MISIDGTYDICFKVTDEAGNDSQAVPFTVRLDGSAPSLPLYGAIANELTYVEGTWSNHPVTFTLSGAIDEGGSDVAGYEYKIDDGDWQSGDTDTLSASGKYLISYRTTDTAGNYSPTVTGEIWIDMEAPPDPVITIRKINGDTLSKVLNFVTFRVFFNEEIEVTITTEDATSGIANLFWKVGENELLQSAESDTVTFRIPVEYKDQIFAFSEDVSGLVSETSVSDGVILEDELPEISIALDPDSSIDQFKFDLVVRDAGSGIKTITYSLGEDGQKTAELVDGQTAPVMKHSIGLSISGIGMTPECFILDVDVLDLAGNHMTASIDLLPLIFKEEIKDLPDPDTTSEEEIEKHQSDILNVIRLYDLLTDDEKKDISEEDILVLNNLLNHLSQSLVIVSKDIASSTTADRIGTSVSISELNNPGISLINIALKATPYTSATMPGFVSAVSQTMHSGRIDLLIAYDIYLLKTLTDTDGIITSERVYNSDIKDTIIVRIPLPQAYENRLGLRVIHIAEDGTISPMNTTVVTVDGQKYLEFETEHFSSFAVIANAQTGIAATGELGNSLGIFAAALAGLAAGAFVLVSVRRRHEA